MSLELTPHIKKLLEAMGCSNIASAEDADKVLRAFLSEAQQSMERLVANGLSPMTIVCKTASDLPPFVKMMKMSAVGATGKQAVETANLARLLAMLATAATYMLKDMAFLGKASSYSRCASCENRGSCDVGEDCPPTEGEDPRRR